mgnify:FL=1
MEVGHSGEAGAAAPSHVAPDGKHACALAIILLHLGVAHIVEESAPNLVHVTPTIVLVGEHLQSQRKQSIDNLPPEYHIFS